MGEGTRPPSNPPKTRKTGQGADGVHHGQRMRELREKAGLTQGDLGERAGTSQQAVQKLETQGRFLKDTIEKYAAALGVPPQEIAGSGGGGGGEDPHDVIWDALRDAAESLDEAQEVRQIFDVLRKLDRTKLARAHNLLNVVLLGKSV